MTSLAWFFSGICVGIILIFLFVFLIVGAASTKEEDLISYLKSNPHENFPDDPAVGDTHEFRGKKYIFTGLKWDYYKKHE